MTSAVTARPKALHMHPAGSFEKNLFKQLFAITLNPAYSAGFKALASEAAFYGREIHPADLSVEAIRAALLASVKKERKARRKAAKAGKPDERYWPEIYDAFIDTAANGCQFEKWCAGECPSDKFGTRDHFSIEQSVTELTYGDVLGVQIFRCENPDGTVDPASLVLAYYSGDHSIDQFDLTLTPAEARKVGEAFQEICGSGSSAEKPGVKLDVTFAGGDRIVLEKLRRRICRDSGYPDRRDFELSLFPTHDPVPVKVRDDYSHFNFLGRHLARAADDAEGVVPPMFDGWEAVVEEAGR